MRAASVFLLGALLIAGCDPNTKEMPFEFDGGPVDTGSGLPGGLGEDCTGGNGCREGLACSGIDGTCQPVGATGTLPEDAPCTADWQCLYELTCSAAGTCEQPGAPGTAGSGAECDGPGDCIFGLECLDGQCQGFQPPYWQAECPEPTAEESDTDTENDPPFKVYFEVSSSRADFFRLPFPNDVLRNGGAIDVDDHPRPPFEIPGVGTPVEEFFSMLSRDAGGFGTQVNVYFRFNRWMDTETLAIMANLYLVDITPGSPEYGNIVATGFRGEPGRSSTICSNWLAIGPTRGRMLRGGTTYAAVIRGDEVDDGQGDQVQLLDKEGRELSQDDDFALMLGDDEPSDATLKRAWNAYAPFRTYLADKAIDAEDIAAAAVFTTQDPQKNVIALRTAVRAEAAPTVADLETDNGGSDFTVRTGTVKVPFYQRGTRPFRTAEDGGDIVDAAGVPTKQEDEDVPFALTVPKGNAPTGGWPVVIFAHGTGGHEQSFIDDGVAKELASIGVATIGLLQVQHGVRRGLSDADAALDANSPERLFYNFFNPRAARDNVVQTAADHFQLVRLIEDFAAITQESLTFDTTRIYFFGHSQGSQGGLLFAAHEPLVQGLVLSGAGGYLTDALLGKTKPINIAAGIRVALGDATVDRFHPLLNIVQAAYESVDPNNFARAVFREDWTAAPYGYPHRHVFMGYGLYDSYTPASTMQFLAKALHLMEWVVDANECDQANPGEEPAVVCDHPDIENIEELPHTATYRYGLSDVTAAMIEYEPAGNDDGHFVMFDLEAARDQWREFVSTMVTDGVPTIPE